MHVGHNCDIGEDVILVALTGISGSCTVGKGAVIAGQVGIGDHAHIGPGVILGGQAGVLSGKTVTNEGLKPGTVLWGTPARPLKQVLREQAVLARLAKKQGKQGIVDSWLRVVLSQVSKSRPGATGFFCSLFSKTVNEIYVGLKLVQYRLLILKTAFLSGMARALGSRRAA